MDENTQGPKREYRSRSHPFPVSPLEWITAIAALAIVCGGPAAQAGALLWIWSLIMR